jgi:hypothetical protein
MCGVKVYGTSITAHTIVESIFTFDKQSLRPDMNQISVQTDDYSFGGEVGAS